MRAGDDVVAAVVSDAVKSAERVLLVIDALTATPSGLTFAQLCDQLQIPRSSAHGLLKTMTGRGYLVLGADRAYRLGIRIFEAGQAYAQAFGLASAARPHLIAARDTLNETVQLAVLDGIENVYVAKEDGNHRLTLVSHIGGRLPAYATALGKVLLAGLSDDEVAQRFDGVRLERFTPTTITSRSRLLAELRTVREQGFATDNAEHTDGVFCTAVPVRDHSGATVAAISVSVPGIRNDPARRDKVLSILTREAQSLSNSLGYRAGANPR